MVSVSTTAMIAVASFQTAVTTDLRIVVAQERMMIGRIEKRLPTPRV